MGLVAVVPRTVAMTMTDILADVVLTAAVEAGAEAAGGKRLFRIMSLAVYVPF